MTWPKKTRNMRLKSCLSWFIHQNPWDFYGFLYLQPTAPRGKDRKTSEKMPPPGLLKHQPPQIGRWFFGGSVDRFSQKMGDFSGRFSRIVFFEMLGKPWKTQVFGCLVFEVTKNQRYSKANRRGFHMMATPKHFWWFQRDSTSLTTALTSGIFWGSFFGSPLRGLNLH